MLRDQSGKHLWIETETGEFEPVESHSQIHSRKRGPGAPDWWVVAKDPGWRPASPVFRKGRNLFRRSVKPPKGGGCVSKPNYGGELQACTPDGRYTFDRGNGSGGPGRGGGRGDFLPQGEGLDGRGDFIPPERGRTRRVGDLIRSERRRDLGRESGPVGLGASLMADAGTGKEGELRGEIHENEVWGWLNRRGQLKTKPGVDDSRLDGRITDRFGEIEEIFKRHGVPLEITSTYEGTEHKQGSLHYQDKAIDLKGKNIPHDKMVRIVDDLKQTLGKDYDILFEQFGDKNRNHIHIEYDPKKRTSAW